MKQIKNEQGFAMVLALLTLVLVAVVGTALIVVSSNVAKTVASERDDQAAFYSAEASTTKLLIDLENIVNKAAEVAKKEAEKEATISFEDETPSTKENRIKQKLVTTFNETFSKELANYKEEAQDRKTYNKSTDTFSIDNATIKLVENNKCDTETCLKTYTLETVGKENGQTRTTSRNLEVKIPDITFKTVKVITTEDEKKDNATEQEYQKAENYTLIANHIDINGNFKVDSSNTKFLYTTSKDLKCHEHKHECPTVLKTSLKLESFLPTLPTTIQQANTANEIKGTPGTTQYFTASPTRKPKFSNSEDIILVMSSLPKEKWPEFKGAYYITGKDMELSSLRLTQQTVFAPNIETLKVNPSEIKQGDKVIVHLVAPKLKIDKHNGNAQFGGTLIVDTYDSNGNSTFITSPNLNVIKPIPRPPGNTISKEKDDIQIESISISGLISSDPIAEQ